MSNAALPTLGGRQWWTDLRVVGGWRVQRHAWTGHCRLLDATNVRRAWGREVDVLDVMATLAGPTTRTHAVVLVHGLGRSAHSFDALAKVLEQQDLEVVRFNYASTRAPIRSHAQALNQVVDGLHGIEQISFVTHSMGAIVLRRALDLSPAWMQTHKLGPSVLLAPPNQGSAVAQRIARFAPARWLLGPALAELADARTIIGLLSPARFATVAGTKNVLGIDTRQGDGLVSVMETHLAGETAHKNFPATHTFIMNDADVMAFTSDFITGH